MIRRTCLLLAGSLALASCAGTSFRSPQQVDWFPGGLYAGGMYGVVAHEADAEDVDRELAQRGYTTSTKLDDDDSAYEIYVGYRFARPFAVELGYVNLGMIESEVTASPPDVNAFLEDLAEVHPVLGAGWQLQGRWFAWSADWVELSLSAGVWAWEGDVDARTATGLEGELDPDDLDPTVGLAATFGIAEHLGLRAAWDRFYLDGDAADAFWLGLEVALLRRTPPAEPF